MAASDFDPDELQPRAFTEVPARTAWGARREKCLAILAKLSAPKLFIDGIPKAYHTTLKGLADARSRAGVERYAFRKPTPTTIAIYRIADAAVPMPARPAPAAALAAKAAKKAAATTKKKAAAK